MKITQLAVCHHTPFFNCVVITPTVILCQYSYQYHNISGGWHWNYTIYECLVFDLARKNLMTLIIFSVPLK